jgi:ketosteroid isomerase-like protein
MNSMSESPDVELLHRAWEAMAQGDLAVLESVLAPDAKWHAIEEGPWSCQNRRAIIDMLSRHVADGLRGSIEETIQNGQRVLVAFRPERPSGGERPLDDGIAYMVVTIREGKIIEMKGCADRAAAMTYAQTGEVQG